MANQKVSELSADASITGVEEIYLADAGVSKKAALSAVAAYVESTLVATPPLFQISPISATLPTASFPQLLKNSRTNWVDYTLDFDDTTSEAAYWYFAIPTGAVFTAATIEIFSEMVSATSGTIGWIVTTLTRAITEVFDTAGNADTVTADTVEDAANKVHRQSKALTVTGWAAGEVLQVKIARDTGNDTAIGDAKFITAVIRLS